MKAGGAASYVINVTSSTGTFNLPVTLVASGLPSGATATFVPAVVTPGAAGATSTMTIQTSATSAELREQPGPRGPGLPLGLGSAGAALAGLLLLRRMPRLAQGRRVLMVLGGLLLASLAMSGCGGGFPGFGSTAKTFTITVTGSNGSNAHATSVVLTIQ